MANAASADADAGRPSPGGMEDGASGRRSRAAFAARAAVGAIILLAGSFAVAPSVGFATHRQDPPPIVLATETGTQRAAQESFCVFAPPDPGQEGGLVRCADSVDMPPARLSTVRRGAVVTISFRGATSVTDGSVHVRVLGEERSFRSFRLAGPRTRWRVRLRPGKYELEVFGRFETADGRVGDTSGSLGLRVPRLLPRPPLAG